MLDSLLVALGVVFPMACYMLIGVVCRKAGAIDRPTMKKFDVLAFKLFLSVLLFKSIYSADFKAGFEWKLPITAIVSVFILFLVIKRVILLFEKDNRRATTLAVTTFRSNINLFGLAVAVSLYGEEGSGLIALMGAIMIPLMNALAVVLFEQGRAKKSNVLQTLLAVLKNPLIIASIAALVLKLLPITIPDLIWNVIKSIASATTPICFISLGVSLNPGEMRENARVLALSTILKMFIMPAILITVFVLMGFRNESLCALMIIFGAPTAIAVFPMAVSMDGDGPLAGQMVCLTTIVSIFSIFLFTFVLKLLALL